MKKNYSTPSMSMLQIENSLPLMSSDNGSPTIGNGFDPDGAADQFSLEKDWNSQWD